MILNVAKFLPSMKTHTIYFNLSIKALSDPFRKVIFRENYKGGEI